MTTSPLKVLVISQGGKRLETVQTMFSEAFPGVILEVSPGVSAMDLKKSVYIESVVPMLFRRDDPETKVGAEHQKHPG